MNQLCDFGQMPKSWFSHLYNGDNDAYHIVCYEDDTTLIDANYLHRVLCVIGIPWMIAINYFKFLFIFNHLKIIHHFTEK